MVFILGVSKYSRGDRDHAGGMRNMRDYIREIIVSIISIAVLTVLHSGIPARLLNVFYFATFGSYFRTILIGLILLAIFCIVPKLREARTVILFLQVFILGFLVAEILYRMFYWKLSRIFPGSPYIVSLIHFDYYLIHRLYLIIPLSILAGLFFSYPRGFFQNYFHMGDWSVNTTLTKRSHDTWKRICVFYSTALLITYAVFAVRALVFPTDNGKPPVYNYPHWWLLVIPIMLYALASAALEEGFFRGLFLPVFSRSVGDRGNLYQAFLFGGIHFDIRNPEDSLAKLVIFTFFGWIWGRATRETGGLGCGILMHFATILVLELRRNFFP